MRLTGVFLGLVACLCVAPLSNRVIAQTKSVAKGKVAPGVKVPLGLLPIPWPADNPYSADKVELGRLLYFDKRLSSDGSVACATCHTPALGWADGAPVSSGIKGQKGGRSAPTTINRAYSLAQFWDGRAGSLEDQAKGPIANPIEMGNTHEAMIASLKRIQGYSPMFAKSFGSPEISVDQVAQAIATFERTLLSGNSAYDKYKAGNKAALTAGQVRGMDVYFKKAKCDQCHEGINFTANAYANIGIGTDMPNPDAGRYAVTKVESDWGRFKTPTLRDISRTAPYMHDGRFKTLDEVVDFYNMGGIKNKNLDETMKPLNLSSAEKLDLVAFLKALNGDAIPVVVPTSFPQ